MRGRGTMLKIASRVERITNTSFCVYRPSRQQKTVSACRTTTVGSAPMAGVGHLYQHPAAEQHGSRRRAQLDKWQQLVDWYRARNPTHKPKINTQSEKKDVTKQKTLIFLALSSRGGAPTNKIQESTTNTTIVVSKTYCRNSPSRFGSLR